MQSIDPSLQIRVAARDDDDTHISHARLDRALLVGIVCTYGRTSVRQEEPMATAV